MKHFEYQIVVQWDTRKKMYTAYSPTLSTFAAKFLPQDSSVAYGKSMTSALTRAEYIVENLVHDARSLGILPPPPDIGASDPVGYQSYEEEEEDLGKMVL